MKYTIQNNGLGFCSIRVLVPESLAVAFIAFIDQKSRENPPRLKTVSHLKNESYLIDLTAQIIRLFNQCLDSGTPLKTSISEVNKKIKVLGFHNVSYDIVRSILAKNGCFRSSAL